MDETGVERQRPDMDRLRRDLYAISISDAETRTTIKEAYEKHRILLEPHGAVGWAGLQHYLRDDKESQKSLTVSVETAHPAKFPEEIQSLLGVDPEVPPSLKGIEDKREHFDRLSVEYPPFCSMLLDRYRTS